MNPIVIAEIAKEHNGNIAKAQLLIDDAAAGGADAVKFQAYSLQDLNPKHPNFERYMKANLPLPKLEHLKTYAAEYDLDFYVSCFSLTQLSKIAAFTTKIKIPSTFLSYEDFVIEAINRFDEVHISTGMHTFETAIKFLDKYVDLGIKKDTRVIPYHCVSLYPTPSNKLRLDRVKGLARTFDIVGYSDHSVGNNAPLIASHLGAEYIEKHISFTSEFKPWCWTEKSLSQFRLLLNYDTVMMEDSEITEEEASNFEYFKDEYKGLQRNYNKMKKENLWL